MNIQSTNNTNFKALHVTQGLRDLQKNINRPPRLKQDIAYISRLIREKNLHKADNFDLTLDYIENNGFIVKLTDNISKTTENTDNICKVYPNKEANADFYGWIDSWKEKLS